MNKKINKAFLLLGGNMPDSKEHTLKAKKLLTDNNCIIIKTSSLFGSEAWGFQSDDFINKVIEIETNLSANELLDVCLNLENQLGRIRQNIEGYSSRIIDIDILFFNDEIYNQEKLIIPHPRLHLRRFTLMPLAEKWPNLVHPIFDKTMEKLLAECNDEGKVWKIL